MSTTNLADYAELSAIYSATQPRRVAHPATITHRVRTEREVALRVFELDTAEYGPDYAGRVLRAKLSALRAAEVEWRDLSRVVAAADRGWLA